jgi:predicted nucleotide-binding protein
VTANTLSRQGVDRLKKRKVYENTRFTAEVLREATATLKALAGEQKNPPRFTLTVGGDDCEWTYDFEEEFYADYRKSGGRSFYVIHFGSDHSMSVHTFASGTVNIEVTARERRLVEAVFDVFERNLSASALPEEEEPKNEASIFIGHGRNKAWIDLKEHLHEKQGYEVSAYEIGARAGRAVRNVLEGMLDDNAFALLVMTAEDKMKDGKMRARQNVIHEVGLFQGRLGFDRAIVLIEEGTEKFSNIEGIEQIRFPRGGIKETFGEVLATLRREFGGGS